MINFHLDILYHLTYGIVGQLGLVKLDSDSRDFMLMAVDAERVILEFQALIDSVFEVDSSDDLS